MGAIVSLFCSHICFSASSFRALTNIEVQQLHSFDEYITKTAEKETMDEIRNLYIRYFENVYKHDEDKLKLPVNQNLNEWLLSHFQQIEKDIYDSACRCFLLYFGTKKLMGLIIVKEIQSDIYITEFVLETMQRLHQFEKRDVFKHLIDIYKTTIFRFICRKSNPYDYSYLTNTLCGTIREETNVPSHLNFDPSEFVCIQVDSTRIS